MKESQEKAESFEKSISKLETLVKNLESGQLSLEDAMSAFQDGVALVKTCQGQLANAEQKVDLLVKASADGVTTKPFPNDP